ncbi:hypothetical protein Tsubulata_016090, partial [Turnera subulata]
MYRSLQNLENLSSRRFIKAFLLSFYDLTLLEVCWIFNLDFFPR